VERYDDEAQTWHLWQKEEERKEEGKEEITTIWLICNIKIIRQIKIMLGR